MRFFLPVSVLFLFVARVVAESQNATFIAQEIAQIPACGLICLDQTIPQVGCSILNTTCQCSSTGLIPITASCMMANCTLLETLELAKIQAAICERPYESRNKEMRIMTIVCATLTYAAVLLRFMSRLWISSRIGLDDWLILAAVCSDIVFTYFGVQIENGGFGLHIWEIEIDTVANLLYWFWICEIVYVITIALVKTSILVFYLHIFPKPSFRIQVWVLMAFCSITAIIFIFTTVFQCHPISYAWDKTLKGTCINYNSVTWVNAGVNILQDILIVVVPISELRSLQLSLRKKLGLYVMFGLGIFVCILSIIRMSTLHDFGLTADPTWDNIPTTLWSTLETTAAILCACMPAIRAGFVRICPRLFPDIWNKSTLHASPSTSKKAMTNYVGTATSVVPSGKAWPSHELSSISSLIVDDEEAHRLFKTGDGNVPGSAEDGARVSPKLSSPPMQELEPVDVRDPKPDLMKPLPEPLPTQLRISMLGRRR